MPFENMLQDCVVCGVLAVDAAGQITRSLPDAERILRRTGPPKDLRDLPPPLQSLVREAQTAGQPVIGRRIVLSPADETPGGVLASVLPIAFGSGTGFVIMLKEVSGIARLEKGLERLDRLASMGTVSASIAHEIKNAFVAIKTFIEIQLDKDRDSELGAIARREMDRIDAMTSHMLKFAAPSQPEFSTVRLHDILDHSLRLVRHRTGRKQISFDREFKAASDACRGDDHQLEQAFVNVLFNAVDAIGAEGSLCVSTDLVEAETGDALRERPESSRLLRVRITDSGGGIAPEQMPRIFEPFFTTKPDGTGSGLAVTCRIIAEHGGTIQVDSRPGGGTTFAILLPMSLATGQA